MSSQRTDSYLLGSTLMVVGSANAVPFIPPSGCNGGFFKIQSGGGTLYLASAFSQAVGTTLYSIGATEVIAFEGPARFFLVAGGATMIVSVGLSFGSPGASGQIAGG